MLKVKLILPSIFFVTLFFTLSNCSENLINENASNSENIAAEQIFEAGEKAILKKRYSDAADHFREIERLYPYSDWARRALIMQAYSNYKDKSYENLRSAANRFIEFNPNDDDVPYAYYMIGLSYYDQVQEIGRDQKLTVEALKVFKLIVDEFPSSEYSVKSKLRYDYLKNQLASKEMEIGRYYLKRAHYAPAINRFRGVIEDFSTTSQVPEALHRLVESYLNLGLVNEAQTAGAILGYNYNSTVWYKRTYELLKSEDLEPISSGNSWLNQVYRQVVKGQWL